MLHLVARGAIRRALRDDAVAADALPAVAAVGLTPAFERGRRLVGEACARTETDRKREQEPHRHGQVLHWVAKLDKQRSPTLPVVVHTFCIGAGGHDMVVGHVFVTPSQETSHRHELAQLTLPHAESMPMQLARQRPVPQLTAPHAPLPPLQVSVHVPPLHVICWPQAADPAHVRVQLPVPHVNDPHTCMPPPPLQSSVQLPVVQLSVPQALTPVQVAVHGAVVQLILPQALLPLHSSVHAFPAQLMPRHALADVQWTSHFWELLQLIVPHAPDVPQLIEQSQPVGQVMLPLPVPVIEQCIVWKSHVPPQTAGHTGGASGPASIGRVPTTQ